MLNKESRTASPRGPQLDDLFGALSDATRRAIIERLVSVGEQSVGDVAARFDISTQAISRHLQVLEQAGLIERRIDRQWRFVRLRPGALEPVDHWLEHQRAHWTSALDRLEALAAAQTPKRRKS
jgi:DNA-binding transcriptional ArsR family regulator